MIRGRRTKSLPVDTPVLIFIQDLLSNNAMSQEFKYKPLTEPDAIRLIELQQASDRSATVRGSLIHTTLSSCDIQDIFSHFTALSYVWGCEQKIETIWIDETPLKITANLFSALRDLRDETRAFLLWADGICINQSDNEEKRIQINMMGQIYATASNTILYLGPADPDSSECYCLTAVRQGHHVANADLDLFFHSIFTKEWFTRVWVFQELVFSVNPWLQCGRTRVKWKKIYSALQETQHALLNSPENQIYKTFSKMQVAWDDHHNSGRKQNSMIDLLQARRGLGVSDPRDMVFAHVGFATDGQHKDLTVDYSETCVQVYTDLARYLAEKHGMPTLLEQVGEEKSLGSIKDLPTWVPDWTAPLSMKRFPMNTALDFETDSSMFRTRELEQAVPAYLKYSDTILFTSSELSLRQIPSDICQRIGLKLAEIDILFPESGYPWMMWTETSVMHEVWPEVYQIWREVISDDNVLPPKLIELQVVGRKGAAVLIGHRYDRELLLSVPICLILAFSTDNAANYLNGRVLARMSSGRLALVPRFAQKGDFVSLVNGGREKSKEFVFRPFQPSDDITGLDARILNSVEGICSGLEQSVMHCKVIGECLRDQFHREKRYLSEFYDKARKFIIALH